MPKGDYQTTDQFRERRREVFWTRIPRTDNDECCWEWTGTRLSTGYGVFSMDHTPRLAHRLAYEWGIGPIPDKLQVLHSCDNPPCCRLSHLFLGTQADNINDKMAKNRGAIGDRHGRAKLKDDDVIAIRQRYHRRKMNCERLAEEFGVHPSQIGKIVRRAIWKHLP